MGVLKSFPDTPTEPEIFEVCRARIGFVEETSCRKILEAPPHEFASRQGLIGRRPHAALSPVDDPGSPL